MERLAYKRLRGSQAGRCALADKQSPFLSCLWWHARLRGLGEHLASDGTAGNWKGRGKKKREEEPRCSSALAGYGTVSLLPPSHWGVLTHTEPGQLRPFDLLATVAAVAGREEMGAVRGISGSGSTEIWVDVLVGLLGAWSRIYGKRVELSVFSFTAFHKPELNQSFFL